MAEKEDRTEQPTQKRLDDARAKGQVVRSADFTAAAIVAGVLGTFLELTHYVESTLYARLLVSLSPTFSSSNIYSMADFKRQILQDVTPMLQLILLIAIVALVLAISITIAIGGAVFTITKVWDWQRFSWVQGLSKPFTRRGVSVLFEDAMKTTILGVAMAFLLWQQKGNWFALLSQLPTTAILQALQLLALDCWIFGLLLFLPGVVDVIIQKRLHSDEMMMSRQEVKDEMKEMSGDPHIKGKIRALRQRLARTRMMDNIPKATVVVTNPEHYAVALQYRQNQDAAPRVVAKGSEVLAERIRAIAREHAIPILPAPPLARALYHQVDIDAEIPETLYAAVAVVLGYIEQMERARMGTAPVPPEWVTPAVWPGGLDGAE